MLTLELVPHLPNLTADEAVRWVAAGLAEADALRQHDQRLYPLTEDPVAMRTAKALHHAWRRWADDAEVLLPPVALATNGVELPALRALRDALAFARGVTAMPPEEIFRRHIRIERGQDTTFTIDEVRRELGLARRA